MGHRLKGLPSFVGIGFPYGFNESDFDRPHQNVPINAIFRVFVGMCRLAEAFLRFGLRVFCDYRGDIAQKGRSAKILFHHDGAGPTSL